MADDEDWKNIDDEDIWVIVESRSLQDLATPIKLSKSIQFTAIDVSNSYIWCGSNRSSLYVFDRQTLKHVYLIPISSLAVDADIVTQLAVYHTEQRCAISIGCQVFASSIQSGTTRKPEVVEALRTEATVTQLVWHSDSAKLYVGDNAGGLYVCSIMTYKMIPRSSLLCRLDSCILQLDFKGHILLAATLTKCTTYHTERKAFTDIGKKARNGYYGAVLLPPVETEDSSISEPICYCARPGLRLWRADTHGKVLATLNFRQTLAHISLSPVYPSVIEGASDVIRDVSNMSQFSYLRLISERHILSTSGNKMVILDPSTSQVLISTGLNDEITSCHVRGSECYVVTGKGDIRCLLLTTVMDYLETLLSSGAMSQAVELTLHFKSWFLKHALLLDEMEELITPENEHHKAFSEAFADAIEAARCAAVSKSSRSSTASSLSGEFIAGSLTNSGSCPSPMQVCQLSPKEVDSSKRSPAGTEIPRGPQTSLKVSGDHQDYSSLSETEKSSCSPSLPQRGSARSLTSLASHRRDSCTSASSFDQSGEHPDDLPQHRAFRKGRKNKSSTFSREGSRDMSKDGSPSTPTADKESSSPAVVVDHVRDVKDQVIDGFSKISTQAKTLISNIKERTISQPLMERILAATTLDDVASEERFESKDSWEEGGSQQGFFIGDEEISMGEEMPSGLRPFLNLTETCHSELTNPVNLFSNHDGVGQLLARWSERLCLVLSQYTRTAGKSTPDGRTLRLLTRICPWRMSAQVAEKCKYLATLCVLHACADTVLDYSIDRESESLPMYLIPDDGQASRYLALEQGRKFSLARSRLFGRSAISENENSVGKMEASITSSTSSTSLSIPSDNHREKTSNGADQIKKLPASSLRSLESDDSSPANRSTSSPKPCTPVDEDLDCEIIDELRTDRWGVLACQFMSVFWFLMDTRRLCCYVEHLRTNKDALGKQKVIWTALVNGLLGSFHDKLEWQPVFSTSLFTTSDVGKQLLERKDKPGLWLIVYLLMRQQQFDEAASIALASQLQVPPLHVMYCLQTCVQLDNLSLSTAYQVFAGYMLSLVQHSDPSSRSQFVKETLSHSELVDFCMQSLESTWKENGAGQAVCVCGQPNLLTASTLPSNHQVLLHLLEENTMHMARVKSAVLHIGGSSALVDLKRKNNEKEDFLRLLLLASDISLFQHHLAGFQLSRENCLYLFNQRARQQTDTDGRLSCLWCQQTYVRSEPLLPWDSLAEVIMERLGPAACIDVLLEAAIPKTSVSHKFFSQCISAQEHDIMSSQLVTDTIEGLERFLWSSELTNNCCDSQLYQLILKETELNNQVRDGIPISDSNCDEVIGLGHALQETKGTRTLEDTQVHWGAAVNLADNCYHCGLHLSQANMTVTVCQRGHSVHQVCHQAFDGRCVQCQGTIEASKEKKTPVSNFRI